MGYFEFSASAESGLVARQARLRAIVVVRGIPDLLSAGMVGPR